MSFLIRWYSTSVINEAMLHKVIVYFPATFRYEICLKLFLAFEIKILKKVCFLQRVSLSVFLSICLLIPARGLMGRLTWNLYPGALLSFIDPIKFWLTSGRNNWLIATCVSMHILSVTWGKLSYIFVEAKTCFKHTLCRNFEHTVLAVIA
jgi:dolichol kinase